MKYQNICLFISFFTLSSSTKVAAQDSYSQGTTSYAKGDYRTAEVDFRQATLAQPGDWKAFYQLANTYVRLNKLAPASQMYSHCLNLNPPDQIKKQCKEVLARLSRSNANVVNNTKVPAKPRAESEVPLDALQERKNKIMTDAEAEGVQIKRRAAEKYEQMRLNSNMVGVMPDGSQVQGLDPTEGTAIFKEAEDEVAKVMAEARRKINLLR